MVPLVTVISRPNQTLRWQVEIVRHQDMPHSSTPILVGRFDSHDEASDHSATVRGAIADAYNDGRKDAELDTISRNRFDKQKDKR